MRFLVSNDKKSETKLDKPAVSVAQESQKKENVTETSEYEKLQGDITSYNNDDKKLKQIREDLRSLMSNEGTKEDKAKLSESIQENIKKLREEIRKNSINHISGTEGDISKLSRVYQELISLNAISEETVKNLLESIKSNNIDFTFTYKTALELLDQKQNNIKELK